MIINPMFEPNNQSSKNIFFTLGNHLNNLFSKYHEVFPPNNFTLLKPIKFRKIKKFVYELINLINHNNYVNNEEIKIGYPNENEFSVKKSKSFNIIAFLNRIFKAFRNNKNHEFISKILSLLNSFIFYSPIKTTIFFNRNGLINELKFLEYKESIIRMTEKINKISDSEVKSKATEALSFAAREVTFAERKKFSSELKKIFIKHMNNHISKAKEIIEYANKYKIIFHNSYENLHRDYTKIIITSFSKEREIPQYIKTFDIKQPHLTPINKYLDIRLSHAIRLMISKVNQQGRNTEIFIGSENQMIHFYSNFGFELIANLNTNSSLQYYLFAKKQNPYFNKIIILGVGNETKLNHLLLQLKFGGIDLNKVIIRGKIKESFKENQHNLESIINSLEEEIDTVFIGNRSLIIIEFAKKYYPNEMRLASNENESETIAKKLLKTYHNLKTYKIGEGVFKFSSFEIQLGSKKSLIICFRMPNGNLAQIATEVLINKGIQRLIMLGAGGSLSNLSSVGSYQLINSTNYNNNKILISDLNVKEMNIDLSEIPLFDHGKNITLDSPLLETKNWLNHVKNSKLTCVDVETYHILKGIQNSVKTGKYIELLAGLFISDVVGECPLIEKIKSLNTWKYLPKFLNICFEYIEKKNNEELKSYELK